MIKLTVNYKVFLFFLITLLSSCSGNTGNSKLISKQTDSSTVKTSNISDSTTIFILSPDGKVIRELYFKEDDESGKYANYIKGYPESDTIKGDFNGDGIIESVWSEIDYKKYLQCQENGNKESCQGIFNFSNRNIPPLVIEYCPFFIFKNEGDLNCDGKDEIGVLPGWFSSGCRQYEVYSLQGNKWIEACEPIHNTYNMRESGIIMIEKDKEREGYAIIRESVDDYITKNPNNHLPFNYIQGSCCASSNVVERTINLK